MKLADINKLPEGIHQALTSLFRFSLRSIYPGDKPLLTQLLQVGHGAVGRDMGHTPAAGGGMGLWVGTWDTQLLQVGAWGCGTRNRRP